MLTRYQDVRWALQHDPRLTAERLTPLLNQLPAGIRRKIRPLSDPLATWMQYYDPPDHTRLRELANKTFTTRTLERLRPRIQTLVNELLADALQQGSMEMIGELAYPLPAIVVAELLGVPASDRDRFKHWSDDIARFLEGVGDHYVSIARATSASVVELTEYLGGLFASRRAQPADDLISALVTVEESGDRLTEAELFGMCSFILQAGHETTTGLIGNGLLALLQHPEQMRRLQQDSSLIIPAVEELLRYDSSIQRISRVAVADFELHGRGIKRGQRIWAMIGAANRDPEQFPDPDRFDVGRDPNRHVAFGFGVHHCLGAPLARLEAQVAFDILMHRLLDLRLAASTVERQPGVSLRTLRSLPVHFAPG